MELYTLDVSGVALVSGLDWQKLTGIASQEREVRAIATEISAAAYVAYQNENGTSCGFLERVRKAELPKKAHSLPVAFAGVPGVAPDSLFIYQDGELAIIAALSEGIPAPGYDGYGSAGEIISHAEDFIKISPNTVKVYGNCDAFPGTPLTLEDIVSKSTTLKKAGLRPVPNPVALLGALAGIVAVGAIGFGWVQHQESEKKRLAQMRAAVVDVDAQYASAIKQLVTQAVPAKPAYKLLKEALANTQVLNGGWGLADILCQPDGCVYTWKVATGTNATFVPPQNATELTYSAKGDAIAYKIAYTQPMPNGLPDVANAPSEQDVFKNVVGKFQNYKDLAVDTAFDASAPMGMTGLAGTPKHVFKSGQFVITGPWYAMDTLQNLPDISSFDSLEVSIGADQSIVFKATGKYYAK
jgi:hypothetical protein